MDPPEVRRILPSPDDGFDYRVDGDGNLSILSHSIADAESDVIQAAGGLVGAGSENKATAWVQTTKRVP